MVNLRTIAEPLLWAMCTVIALKPLVDATEVVLQKGYGVIAYRIGAPAPKSYSDAELSSLVDDGSTPALKSHGKPGSIERSMRVAIRAAAVALTLSGVAISWCIFFVLMLNAAHSLQSNAEVYKDGAMRVGGDITRMWNEALRAMNVEDRQHLTSGVVDQIVRQTENLLYVVAGFLLDNVRFYMTEAMLALLYVVVWLIVPMPVPQRVDRLFRRYILIKAAVCAGYGFCAYILLAVIGVDLSYLFGLICGLVNSVPEVGPFIGMVVPIPFILLDSRIPHPWMTTMFSIFGQMVLKFIFANVIEVKLISDDEHMKLHPIVIIFCVAFFGFLWGPTGMLISVPLMGIVKVAINSESVPEEYRNPILTILEGDASAPERQQELEVREDREDRKRANGRPPAWARDDDDLL
jgi:predicted PurR-regulated permease PerM